MTQTREEIEALLADADEFVESEKAHPRVATSVSWIAELADAIRQLLDQTAWRPIEDAPKDEAYGSFMVLLPENDVTPFVELQVSVFEDRMYPDGKDSCIDWDDAITTATHWRPCTPPPKGGE
jgi:hypothetical protein